MFFCTKSMPVTRLSKISSFTSNRFLVLGRFYLRCKFMQPCAKSKRRPNSHMSKTWKHRFTFQYSRVRHVLVFGRTNTIQTFVLKIIFEKDYVASFLQCLLEHNFRKFKMFDSKHPIYIRFLRYHTDKIKLKDTSGQLGKGGTTPPSISSS